LTNHLEEALFHGAGKPGNDTGIWGLPALPAGKRRLKPAATFPALILLIPFDFAQG